MSTARQDEQFVIWKNTQSDQFDLVINAKLLYFLQNKFLLPIND